MERKKGIFLRIYRADRELLSRFGVKRLRETRLTTLLFTHLGETSFEQNKGQKWTKLGLKLFGIFPPGFTIQPNSTSDLSE